MTFRPLLIFEATCAVANHSNPWQSARLHFEATYAVANSV